MLEELAKNSDLRASTLVVGPASQGDLAPFLGRFESAEARDVVRARIYAAIDQAIAPLSWPLRVAARSGLRFVTEPPDWVTIEHNGTLLSMTFSNGVALRAGLGAAPHPHEFPAGVQGTLRHFWEAGRLCTEAISEHGTIRNEYERVSDRELLGHALLVSQYFPLPLRYSLRSRRA